MADFKITSNTGLSLAMVGTLLTAAFWLGVQIASVRHSIDGLAGKFATVERDVQELSGRIVGKGCHGVHRPQLLGFAQTLKRDNPNVKVPNPYNPTDVPFPPDKECAPFFQHNDEP